MYHAMFRRAMFLAIGGFGLIGTGCDSHTESPSHEPAPGTLDSELSPRESSWVTSDDGVLALRLSVRSNHATANESIHVVATIRNLSQQKVTIIRPFGDWYAAKAVGLKIWDAEHRIPYTGANATYVIGADAFAVVGPGEAIEDQMELTTDNFADVEPPRPYKLRFDYSYKGQWDTTAAAGNSGISNA